MPREACMLGRRSPRLSQLWRVRYSTPIISASCGNVSNLGDAILSIPPAVIVDLMIPEPTDRRGRDRAMLPPSAERTSILRGKLRS